MSLTNLKNRLDKITASRGDPGEMAEKMFWFIVHALASTTGQKPEVESDVGLREMVYQLKIRGGGGTQAPTAEAWHSEYVEKMTMILKRRWADGRRR